MHFWYYKEPDYKNDVKDISIKCSNCGKDIDLSMDNMNINYKDIFTVFVFNKLYTMLLCHG